MTYAEAVKQIAATMLRVPDKSPEDLLAFAVLRRAGKVVEAVEACQLYDTGIPGVTLLEFSEKAEMLILRAALDYRKEKEGK